MYEQLILEKYSPVVGSTYYIYRLFCGRLFASDRKLYSAELLSEFVWS